MLKRRLIYFEARNFGFNSFVAGYGLLILLVWLQKESPKEEVEKLIIQAGGVKSLIGCLHGIAEIHKAKKDRVAGAKPSSSEKGMEKRCPIPDGLPKSLEELEEEEMGRMPDSPYTRLLRSKGRFPAWYSPAPDHETD